MGKEEKVVFTGKGMRRVNERTCLVPRDVLNILNARAYVNLGVKNDYWFGLFYDPNDKRCKIALIACDDSSVVSVWEEHYRLPEEISPVTPRACKQARQLFRNFIFSQLPEPEPKPFYVTLSVVLACPRTDVHQEVLGVVEDFDTPLLSTVTRTFFSQLASVERTVSATLERRPKPSKVRYVLDVSDGTGKRVKSYQIQHQPGCFRLLSLSATAAELKMLCVKGDKEQLWPITVKFVRLFSYREARLSAKCSLPGTFDVHDLAHRLSPWLTRVITTLRNGDELTSETRVHIVVQNYYQKRRRVPSGQRSNVNDREYHMHARTLEELLAKQAAASQPPE